MTHVDIIGFDIENNAAVDLNLLAQLVELRRDADRVGATTPDPGFSLTHPFSTTAPARIPCYTCVQKAERACPHDVAAGSERGSCELPRSSYHFVGACRGL